MVKLTEWKPARVMNWNAGAQRLKGYAAQEAIGLALAHGHVDQPVPGAALDAVGLSDFRAQVPRGDGAVVNFIIAHFDPLFCRGLGRHQQQTQ